MADAEKHHHTKHEKHHHHHKKEEGAQKDTPKKETKKETKPAPQLDEEDAEEAKFNKENEAKRKAKQKQADKLTSEDKEKLVLNSTEPPQPAATRTEALVPGTKAKMWKQDPEETNFGVSIVFIPELVRHGPADKEVKIVPPEGHAKVEPDENGDLCFVDPNKDVVEFEMVHCYCVARIVLNMFERFFRQFDDDYILMWHWFSPSYIRICPRSGDGSLPVYSRKDKCIYCYEYEADGKKYSCVGFDLLAHEIGKAYLDGMKPDWADNKDTEVQAIINAFADLTTIFGLLTQLDVCELLLCDTKGNLHKDNFVCLIGERFGKKNKGDSCLRNASNDFTYDENCKDVDHLSQVLVGCIYDIIADFFVVYMDPSRYDAAESLVRVAGWVRQMFFFAVWTCSDDAPTFKEISRRMLFYTLEKKWDRSWVSVVKGELKERNMFWKEMETATKDI